METITYTGPRRMIRREIVFSRPLKRATLIKRLKRYIETSDWDERIINPQPVFDKLCWGVVILCGFALAPFIIHTFLQ